MMKNAWWNALLVIVMLGVAATVEAQQVDTVRVGSEALRGARLHTGTYDIVSFRRADGHDAPLSETTQSITRSTIGEQEVYRIHTIHTSESGDTTVGSIIVRATDFALLHHRVTAVADSAAVTANRGHLTGWVVLPDEPIRLIDRRLAHPVFPVEGQIPWLFPLLPLSEGYSAAIPHYSQWQGDEVWTVIRVLGSELRELNGETLDCWKVDGGELFPGFGVTYWVEKNTRRVVEGLARGPETGPEFWSRIRRP